MVKLRALPLNPRALLPFTGFVTVSRPAFDIRRSVRLFVSYYLYFGHLTIRLASDAP